MCPAVLANSVRFGETGGALRNVLYVWKIKYVIKNVVASVWVSSIKQPQYLCSEPPAEDLIRLSVNGVKVKLTVFENVI